MRQTLVHHFLEHSAAERPEKVALVHQDRRLTYAELDGQSSRLAGALARAGVARGDRVAIFMDNSVEAVVSLFAALKCGAAFILVNPTTKTEKLEFILNNSRARVLLTQAVRIAVAESVASPHLAAIVVADGKGSPGNATWGRELNRQSLPASKEMLSYDEIITSDAVGLGRSACIDLDLASVIYTSGSTGTPKGVMLSHLNMVSAADSITTYLENTPDDIIINVLPISFDYGLYQVLMAFKIGGTVILEKSFTYPYQLIDVMVREKVTGFPGVPTIFAILLGLKDLGRRDFTSLRYITNTAAALPASHIRRLRELFPQARLYSMYGLTECKRVSYLPPAELDRRPNSVGRGMPNEEVYIVDEQGTRVGPGVVGELVVRGANVMLGYWESPDETAASLKPGPYPGERVLYTGDLFRMDEEGFLYFIARKDDIIKSRGEKVSPREVENALYHLDGVLEAAVIGAPDEILGEAVQAFVVLEEGSHLTEQEILTHCAEHLEDFMVPKAVKVVPELPKTSTGKIRKKGLRSDAGKDPRAQAGMTSGTIS
jgi:amino acid adenylation domain-containing protein